MTHQLRNDPVADSHRSPKNVVWRQMFEALIDPRSIQWMLMIGGGLCVLGLVVWLISLGVFKDPHVLAIALGVGTLAILGAGWFFTLRTRFRIAGQALTFLGCVVAPLNLWFYHAQNLVTVDGHLWVGGVVCCLLYAATVVVLRDPAFMYAFEAGVTLTTLLLLGRHGQDHRRNLAKPVLHGIGPDFDPLANACSRRPTIASFLAGDSVSRFFGRGTCKSRLHY